MVYGCNSVREESYSTVYPQFCTGSVQVSIMVQEHREEVGRLHEYIQGSY